ncbi:porin [Roseospira goensis]|uniref:Outer membrane protein OmpU n=1 Tax=Roseospira goensis TaxID=391922 RepID=A0A7W6S245_9PROT|nr:porin [Roseospira goensis]MBB4287005.1 outer membrane protein OmpU [Roseospira goensis]
MKKVLFGTTALIAAAAFAGTAHADKIKLSIGGKQEVYFGVADVEDNAGETYASTGMTTDTELYFSGSTTLDNGLTVRAMISLEADARGAQNADETYITMSGGFGALQLGARQDVVMNQTWGGTSQGGQDWDEAYGNTWTPSPDGHSGGMYSYYSQDDISVGYTSPSFFGFSVAASYAPDLAEANVTGFQDWNNTGAAYKDGFAIGGAFNNEFSGIGIHADVSYWYQHGVSTPDRDLIRGALALTYAGFELGGAYGVWDRDGDDNDTHVFQVGAGYENGPYGIDFNYAHTDNSWVAGGDETTDYFKVAGKYILGPGINLTASVFHETNDKDNSNIDRDTTGGLMGVALSF